MTCFEISTQFQRYHQLEQEIERITWHLVELVALNGSRSWRHNHGLISS